MRSSKGSQPFVKDAKTRQLQRKREVGDVLTIQDRHNFQVRGAFDEEKYRGEIAVVANGRELKHPIITIDFGSYQVHILSMRRVFDRSRTQFWFPRQGRCRTPSFKYPGVD